MQKQEHGYHRYQHAQGIYDRHRAIEWIRFVRLFQIFCSRELRARLVDHLVCSSGGILRRKMPLNDENG